MYIIYKYNVIIHNIHIYFIIYKYIKLYILICIFIFYLKINEMYFYI